MTAPCKRETAYATLVVVLFILIAVVGCIGGRFK